MTNYSDFLDELWERLDRSLVFEGKETPAYLSGIECPFCHHREAWIRKNGFKLRCNRRKHCGREIHILSHVAKLEGAMPRGEAFKRAIQHLADLAGVPVPAPSADQVQHAEDRERRRNLLDTFWKSVTEAFQDETLGQPARDYLVRTRGFPPTSLETLPVGFYTKVGAIAAQLRAANLKPEEIDESGLLNPSWEGRLIGAWRDYRGWIETFWARDIAGTSDRKILYRAGAEIGKLTPYGMDVAMLHGGRDELFVVEGPIDVLHLHARDRKNVVALGGASCSAERLERIRRAGVKRLTLLLDNDPHPDGQTWPGLDGIRTIVRNASEAPNTPDIHVVHPRHLGAGAKDPDELVRAQGIDAFDQLLAARTHGFRFFAEDLVERRRPAAGEWTDPALQALLREARDFEDGLADPGRILELQTFFWAPLRDLLRIDPALLDAHLIGLRDRILAEDREKQVRSHLEVFRLDFEAAYQGRDLEEAKQLIWHGADRLRVADRALRADPVRAVAEELDDHQAYLARWRGQEFIGLPQRTLPALDQATLGLRGLMLLAAAPNVGKTALAVQLGLDVLEANPDACFLFVSLEMRRQEILSRIHCKLAQMDWKTLVFGSSEGRGRDAEACYTSDEYERLQLARKHLQTLGSRICILDERNFPNPTVPTILAQLEQLKKRTGTHRAFLLVDYLQVWPIPDGVKLRSELDEDKWRIGQMKTLRDQAGDDAVMVVSEIRKPQGSTDPEWKGASLAHIMGSARGAYTPDMVFLFNPFTEKDIRDAAKSDKACSLTRDQLGEDESVLSLLAARGLSPVRLEIAKGRDGVLRRSFDITFWYRQARFEEGLVWSRRDPDD